MHSIVFNMKTLTEFQKMDLFVTMFSDFNNYN